MTTSTAITALSSAGSRKLPEIIRTALTPEPFDSFVPPERYDIPVHVTAVKGGDVEKACLEVVELEPVTVVERRKLAPTELAWLDDERTHLDNLAKYIEARKDAHRAMIFNHLDVELEEAIEGTDLPVPEVDSKGHYIAAGSVVTPSGRKFTRELRTEAPVLTAEALLAVSEDGALSHDDYLAMTSQVRVLDEEKTMLLLRTKPQLVEAIARAAKPGKTSAAVYRRK